MSTVCCVLGVARSNVQSAGSSCERLDRSTHKPAAQCRRPVTRTACRIAPLATCGYLGAAALVNRQRRVQRQASANHKRVYRVMRAGAYFISNLSELLESAFVCGDGDQRRPFSPCAGVSRSTASFGSTSCTRTQRPPVNLGPRPRLLVTSMLYRERVGTSLLEGVLKSRCYTESASTSV